MFSHVMVGVSDFERALAFYRPVLDALGVAFRFLEPERPGRGGSRRRTRGRCS